MKLPSEALRAGAEALQEHVHADERDPWAERARVVLEAALPILERHVQRQTAIHILALDSQDRAQVERTNNRGPFYDMRSSLRRLVRGERLPRIVADTETAREIHHRDGDARNNDLGNLELRDAPES